MCGAGVLKGRGVKCEGGMGGGIEEAGMGAQHPVIETSGFDVLAAARGDGFSPLTRQ